MTGERRPRQHEVAALRASLRRSQDQAALAAAVLALLVQAQDAEELAAVADLVRVLADELAVHRA